MIAVVYRNRDKVAVIEAVYKHQLISKLLVADFIEVSPGIWSGIYDGSLTVELI